ncbi:tRNA (adenosine(37)-N6)-threonylcarbamoyltransferase complex ATPase subunit type 1 TsaE [Candidatus Kirkpatrickella diaphorinae]|uniref:tRNA threonylcarbamoyladenosine biosynthesis protein TsaE n=1 Tax=Candidatus Kirkpatrickella diaphorinae TaxID=2984322 RepID=A0ABY6GIV1_9PROT|nr:tRNA (adenosine(37)-N6)-threonylcarbamoyltransferase complex ATPase subunit type 1 TsaE [Candidatus Kirkpatrickella diaphorinae]UYH50770.1 tRNA (adenosine(37)-N6)-threonylcarbamoyltransferase complex ATPase subunit type 1 TsaE [Candidatus Kirkpatrickella diaphorinae]
MTEQPLRYHVASIKETEALARKVAQVTMPGDVIALHGEMGVGKSVFARAFIRARAGDAKLDVPSPTFALVQLYNLPSGDIVHYDLWRLDAVDAMQELGLDADEGAIMLVEWPEKAGRYLPAHALHIHLSEPDKAHGAKDTAKSVENGPRDIMISGWHERLA